MHGKNGDHVFLLVMIDLHSGICLSVMQKYRPPAVRVWLYLVCFNLVFLQVVSSFVIFAATAIFSLIELIAFFLGKRSQMI